MANRVKLQAFRTVGRPVEVAIDPDATEGAVLGTNLTLGSAVTLPNGRTLPAGYVLQPADLAQLGTTTSTAVADWTQIVNVPANVQEAAALTGVGLLVRQASGDWLVRSLAAGSGLSVTNGNGDAGNPTLSLAVATASGQHTPTLTGVANVAASSASQAQYLRVGDTVTVSGRLSVTPTAAGLVQLGMTLPVASNFGAPEDAAGTATAQEAAYLAGSIEADSVNDRVTLSFVATTNAARTVVFTYSYQVLP